MRSINKYFSHTNLQHNIHGVGLCGAFCKKKIPRFALGKTGNL